MEAIVLRPQISPREVEAAKPRCPLCFGNLRGATLETCSGCQTHYHAECHAELGGCSTLGCGARRDSKRREDLLLQEEPETPTFEREERIEFRLKLALGAVVGVLGTSLLASAGMPFLVALMVGGGTGAAIGFLLAFGPLLQAERNRP